jgi:dienelactone hydrolase
MDKRSRFEWCRGAVVTLLATLAVSGCGTPAGETPPPTPQQVEITVMDTTPPPGVNVPGAHWIKIVGAGGLANSEQIAAVFRPFGPGPFPLVVELHGSMGLKDVDVQWAARLAGAGFIAVAGCWETSTVPPDTFQFYELTIRFIACPDLRASSIDATAALIAAGRKQPGVRTDAVGLYGMSAGGGVAEDVVAARHDIRAAALDSPTGGPETINAPVLVLAGTADENVPFTSQRDYVEALQRAGKQVEWHYFQGGRHTLILDPANKDDAIRRIIDFFSRRLKVGTSP